jgi:hypothetical protein
MRPYILAFTLLLTACGDVRSFEQTSAQFQRDRAQLHRLAEAAVACTDASRFVARHNEQTDCVGEIERELDRLGYKLALVSDGRWRVAFVNGDDGTGPLGSVMSGIAYYRVPRGLRSGERALTEAPHQWFYFQHD